VISTNVGANETLLLDNDVPLRAKDAPLHHHHNFNSNACSASSLIPPFAVATVRYSEDLWSTDPQRGSGGSPEELLASLDDYRRRVLVDMLRQSSDEETSLFRLSFEEWRAANRASMAGWRCSVEAPVSWRTLKPVQPSDMHILDKIYLSRNSVVRFEVDAIVNAVNQGCMGGGGVDGAIHEAAGPQLFRECATFNGCATGAARITKGYDLPARFVLHTAGPIGRRPDELHRCYQSCFALFRHHGLRSVAFCGISTGIFGYPLQEATRIALSEAFRFVKDHHDEVDAVIFACFTEREFDAYQSAIDAEYHTVMTTCSPDA